MLLDLYLNLTKKYVGLNPTNKYFYNPYFDSFLILVLFFLLSRLFVFIATKIILKLTRKTKTTMDDILVKKSNGPISIILLLIGLRLALIPLGINKNLADIAVKIIFTLIYIIITYLVIIFVEAFLDNLGTKLHKKNVVILHDELVPIFKKFSRIFISLIGLMFILPIWGIQIGPLLAGLGIVGIAVAFALQSTLGNIFGGASLLMDKSIKVGDIIKLDEETIGRVVDVGLRSTKLHTFDNEIITLPNGKLADSRIINFVQPDPSVRFNVNFGVEYGSSISKVRKIVLDTLKKIPDVLKKPSPKVLMIEMGDFALKFTALFWVPGYSDRYDDTKALVVEEIYNALIKGGIKIPFPTRTVYTRQEKK
ncbi:MAG TPA: mechanosensitive ion channel family protein [Candidatus Nanoarchaeia archaeon]|nr:mechanosensitive ion channel family protein [Candidatus Nanoarchaeia archaeon]